MRDVLGLPEIRRLTNGVFLLGSVAEVFMSARLDALRTQMRQHRFATDKACVSWLCSSSFPHGEICESIVAWEEMLTTYAYRRSAERGTSPVKAWFFVMYRLCRIVPDPLDELAGAQLAVKMWSVGMRSPTAFDQEMLLDYLFDELCGCYINPEDSPPPVALRNMGMYLSMRLVELGTMRLRTTSHGETLPEDFTDSLWGAADGVISLWEKVGQVAEEYERKTGDSLLPDEHIGYIVQRCFVDYLWIFMAGDRADINRITLFKLICRFPHESRWQTLFQRLMDEGHFDRETIEGLLACETLPSDDRMEDAAECVAFWRNEAVDLPLHHYLSNYFAAEAVS